MALTKINYTGQGVVPHAKMPTGSVLQVQSTTTDTQVPENSNTNYASPTDTGLACSITPSATNSKVLILISASLRGDGGTAWVNASLKRGGSLLSMATTAGLLMYAGNHTNSTNSWQYLDSPNTTSSTEYRLFFTRYGGSGTAYFTGSDDMDISTITLMEIAG